MNFAEEHLRPVAAYLAPTANGIGIELEPFDITAGGTTATQEEPELNFNGFTLASADLRQLTNQTFEIS